MDARIVVVVFLLFGLFLFGCAQKDGVKEQPKEEQPKPAEEEIVIEESDLSVIEDIPFSGEEPSVEDFEELVPPE